MLGISRARHWPLLYKRLQEYPVAGSGMLSSGSYAASRGRASGLYPAYTSPTCYAISQESRDLVRNISASVHWACKLRSTRPSQYFRVFSPDQKPTCLSMRGAGAA